MMAFSKALGMLCRSLGEGFDLSDMTRKCSHRISRQVRVKMVESLSACKAKSLMRTVGRFFRGWTGYKEA